MHTHTFLVFLNNLICRHGNTCVNNPDTSRKQIVLENTLPCEKHAIQQLLGNGL